MTAGPQLVTDRLLLRRWRERDRADFAAMNADPEVMQHFPASLSRAESDGLVDRIEAGFDTWGFGLWATELVATAELLGFVGLSVPEFTADWMHSRPKPIVEVGWRLRRSAWGQGFATEAARAALQFGFTRLELPEVVSFTVVANLRSQAVMRRLGMTKLATYDHPVPGRAPLPSVVYVRPAERR